ncbi:hypothetical protein DDB_G0281717 [Dictyostelium discoideum AX4]|uniref:Monalysin Pore-forming domain-containing protein n=1 Tax=Dictyostelium discoideum TaxID=44689 RepID=Q54TJ1_DICDI|nr:hypothetical protein DDB_G0281717 [Dictyostelium discoideum AX4]EAL66620.1 hypothetical protein DDB_G0281717 [Dictyostelium discoideum AX4]|eukprot:XP_640600.1 hypothetical protein DDB_G0281717 [Dictyostelium discoideum AX4]
MDVNNLMELKESILKAEKENEEKLNKEDYRCYVAPCAAFAKYIKSYPVVGTVETTLEKKKGFTTRFKTTDDINEKLSASFKGWK